MRSNNRRRELAKIHIAKAQLGLDDDTYRTMLATVAGVSSAADLDTRGRAAVLDHMRQRGFKSRPKRIHTPQHPGTPHNLEREPQLQKIEALLAELAAPWAYADAIGKRMFGIERVSWLRTERQRSAVIAALHNALRKKQQETQA